MLVSLFVRAGKYDDELLSVFVIHKANISVMRDGNE